MDSCIDCLFRDIAEPERCGDIPFWTCSCKSSPMFGKITTSNDLCSFFIPEYLYNYLVEEARSCNSSD